MTTLRQINELATEMHNKKIINLDLPARDLLSLQNTGLQSKGEEAGLYVLGGDHYVVVCGRTPAGAVVNPAQIRGNG